MSCLMRPKRRHQEIIVKQFRCDHLYSESARLARIGRDQDARKCFRRAEKVRYGPGGIGLWFCYFRGPKGDEFDPFCNWTCRD